MQNKKGSEWKIGEKHVPAGCCHKGTKACGTTLSPTETIAL